MIGARKVCGILTEVVASGDRLATVIGIGLNVNLDLTAEGLPATATSLSAELGKTLPRGALFSAIVARLHDLLTLPSPQLVSVVHERWEALLWRMAQGVRLSDGKDVVEGVVEGLAPSGGLLLRIPDGTLREITTGELLPA